MKTRISVLQLATWVLATSVLLFPADGNSQCMTTTVMKNTGGGSVQVYKILSAVYNCNLTMQNAFFCSPTTLGNTTSFLLATAMTATVQPSCVWNCACGTVTIDGANGGLPVELTEFSVGNDDPVP